MTDSSSLFNYNVILGSPGGSVIAYLQVNYQTLPWREYAKPQAPGYSRLIPVRHPLDLREEYPDCGLGFEEVRAIYSNGNFYVWEVNARNIMASLNSVIANQKPYALRDAIGIAYAPYNRQQAGGWTGYMGKDDPLSLLLAGGDNFEVSANSENYPGAYTAPFKGTGYSHDVYYFSLVVAYGVHYEYFYDTSYGASEYRHRPDEKSNSEIVCGGDGPAFFMHPGTRLNNYQYKWTTEELEARGGWTLPVLEMPWPTADSWISPYPPVGCVSQR